MYKFGVACFCDFSHQREVQLGAPLLYSHEFLCLTERFVDEHAISLRTFSYFRFLFLYALYIIPADASNLLRYGKVSSVLTINIEMSAVTHLLR